MTYDSAIRAVNEGSYRQASDDDLREMLRACMDIHGANPIAHHRCNQAAEIIRLELNHRNALAIARLGSAILLPSADIHQAIEEILTPDEAWDLPRLQNYITNQIEENQTLEYKASGALGRDTEPKNEVTRDVSAMANAAGGIIIYGISEFREDKLKHLPEAIDPINGRTFSREWLESIITQIRPRIPRVRISPVRVDSVPDGVVYVVEVPQSETAHQALDGKYYRRLNFQRLPMPDHEIRDVMNRVGHPHIKASLRFVVYPKVQRDGRNGALIVSLENTGRVLAKHVAAVIDSPLQVQQNWLHYDDHAVIVNDSGGAALRLRFSNHNSSPIFPSSILESHFRFRFASGYDPLPDRLSTKFKLVVYADDLERQFLSFECSEVMVFASDRA